MSSSSKQYGLTVPKSKGGSGGTASTSSGVLKPRLACFADDSDSDSGETTSKKSRVETSLLQESERSVQKRQTKLQIQKALAEDPTVYQYDEVYDDLEQKKADTVAKKKDQSKKPKYIESLLKSAERRKMENERRVERQVQKEREEEGAQFADKESFVTSAYRAKLEEFKIQEEQERREEALESLTDVSKQKDLSGFYRHLYRETVAKEPTQAEEPKEIQIKQEPGEVKPSSEQPRARKYRERQNSSSSSSSSNGESSSSSDSESSDSEPPEPKEKDSAETKAPVEKQPPSPKSVPSVPVEQIIEEAPPKPKINIWEKRTVGPVFEAALQRYYARKAARES